MPTKLWRGLFLSVGILVFASVSYGQAGSIRGTVIGEDGQPLMGALIKIERIGVRGNYKVKTKKKGNFYHAGLPLGFYNILCEVDGQIVDQINNTRLLLAVPMDVTFDLQKLAARRNSGPTEKDIASMTPGERKRYEDALKRRQQSISRNKELNDVFNNGMVALKMQNYDTAVQSLLKASTLDDKQHVIWANLGEAQAKLALTRAGSARTKLYVDAIAAYEKAIEIDGTNAAYHNNLGLVMVRARRIEAGQMKLAEAAMLDPGNAAKYFFNLGAVMINTGNTDGAIQAFTKATEVNVGFAKAYYQLGMALVGKAETQPDGTVIPAAGTIEAFQKYVELEPNGQFVAGAQGMLAGLTAAVETQYEDKSKKKRKRRRKKAS